MRQRKWNRIHSKFLWEREILKIIFSTFEDLRKHFKEISPFSGTLLKNVKLCFLPSLPFDPIIHSTYFFSQSTFIPSLPIKPIAHSFYLVLSISPFQIWSDLLQWTKNQFTYWTSHLLYLFMSPFWPRLGNWVHLLVWKSRCEEAKYIQVTDTINLALDKG